ncbi:MAG: glycosyltransferase family 4 protein, partial [Chloroflexi bacterium]|nr:glycosyltransferase family 4 protein [Chloroflexota bacterium]
AGPDSGQPNLWRGERETDNNLTAGIPTHRLFFKPTKPAFISQVAYFAGVWRICRKLVNEGFRPDIIHAHSYVGGVAAVLIGKLSRIPVVVSEHSSGFLLKTLAGKTLRQARIAFNGAALVLPVSQALQAGIRHYGLGKRFQIIPNVVNDLFFAVEPPVKIDDSYQILFVGGLRSDHIKGALLLLPALARLNEQRVDWHLHIIGDGPARAEYENLADDLGIAVQVTFQGSRRRKEVADFMRRADFLVVSSLVETFSVVAAEALAAGVPVLATRCGGPEDFVNNEMGRLVQPGSVDALYDGLVDMLRSLPQFAPEEISRYAAEKFSSQAIGEGLHKAYMCVYTEPG